MKKGNILFILHLPPPVHGAAMMGKHIMESSLINETFTADYINLSSSTAIEQIGKAGVAKFLRIIKLQWAVIKLLATRKYELCYMTLTAAGAGFYKDLLIVLLLKIAGKKIIYHFHNKGIAEKKGGLTKFLYSFTFRNTKSILLSPSLYPDIQTYVPMENVFICANGIPEEINYETEKQDTGQKTCNLLFLSNMIEEKGVYVLLEACSRLKKTTDNFTCHFVGPWGDVTEKEFNVRVANFQLEENIVVHGKKYGAEKNKLLAEADIFVFPTYYHNECFPLVLLEAMQFHLPVISTREGGIPDIVSDTVTGFTVEQKNVEQLAGKLEVLINNPALRIQMGNAGYEYFKKELTLPKFERRLTDILQKALLSDN